MRISLFTAGCLFTLVCSTAMAGEPEIFPPASLTPQQTQHDLRDQEGNLKRNSWDAAHDQRDIHRDEVARNADKSREERDLSKGDLSGAKYWNRQRKDENAEIRHDKADLAHSRRDIKVDHARIASLKKGR
jgi:hypothetical protein